MLLVRSLIAACVLIAASSARAQVTVTHDIGFYPFLEHGRLVGCQVAFVVVRQDYEFSRGAPVIVNGLLLFDGARAGVVLRLGVAPGTPPLNIQPPERAYLVDGLRTNVAEGGAAIQSDLPGSRLFPFALGEVTLAAIVKTIEVPRLEIAYGMPRTNVDARFTVDFDAETSSRWAECLGEVVAQAR